MSPFFFGWCALWLRLLVELVSEPESEGDLSDLAYLLDWAERCSSFYTDYDGGENVTSALAPFAGFRVISFVRW